MKIKTKIRKNWVKPVVNSLSLKSLTLHGTDWNKNESVGSDEYSPRNKPPTNFSWIAVKKPVCRLLSVKLTQSLSPIPKTASAIIGLSCDPCQKPSPHYCPLSFRPCIISGNSFHSRNPTGCCLWKRCRLFFWPKLCWHCCRSGFASGQSGQLITHMLPLPVNCGC